MATKKGKTVKPNLASVGDIFSKPIKEVKEAPETSDFVELHERPTEDLELEGDENLSAFQIKERNDRTIFVGNVDLDIKPAEVKKYFKDCGSVEKIWFRSVPVDKGKMPQKAAVVLKKFKEGAAGQNCYVLFSEKEAVEKALNLNGTVIKSNHIRVDYAIRRHLDFDQTIFIGNLHFAATEEELRKLFQKCGAIENIRIIRDPSTHVGKGIAYVTFKEKESFQNALKENGTEFKNRELRIKKAVPSKRLEKKKKKVLNQQNAQRRLKQQNEFPEEMEEEKMEDFNKFVGKHTSEELAENDVDIENRTSVSPGLIRKRIKKVQAKQPNVVNALKVALKMRDKMKKKLDREVFNGVNEREKRKEQRKKREMMNKMKTKNERANKKKPKKDVF
jgi:nucleolar protein 12